MTLSPVPATPELLHIALEACLATRDFLLKSPAGSEHATTQTHEKTDFHDVVTRYDIGAQKRIADVLLAAAPHTFIFGEESDSILSTAGPATLQDVPEGAVMWYVDPIDGTSNFAAGYDQWCVSIGAFCDGTPLAGVIYQPGAGAWATDGTGVHYYEEHVEEGTATMRPARMVHATNAGPHTGLVATQFPSVRRLNEETLAGFAHLINNFRGVRRPGSTALALAGVASGHFLATANLGTHPWDVAGGIALVEASGAMYIGIDESGELVENLPLAPHYVAASTKASARVCLKALGFAKVEAALARDPRWGALPEGE